MLLQNQLSITHGNYGLIEQLPTVLYFALCFCDLRNCVQITCSGSAPKPRCSFVHIIHSKQLLVVWTWLTVANDHALSCAQNQCPMRGVVWWPWSCIESYSQRNIPVIFNSDRGYSASADTAKVQDLVTTAQCWIIDGLLSISSADGRDVWI